MIVEWLGIIGAAFLRPCRSIVERDVRSSSDSTRIANTPAFLASGLTAWEDWMSGQT